VLPAPACANAFGNNPNFAVSCPQGTGETAYALGEDVELGAAFLDLTCSARPTSAVCPDGSAFDPQRGACYPSAEPIPTCMAGFHWSTNSNDCILAVSAASQCPSGTTFQEIANGEGFCHAPKTGDTCPAGFTYTGSTCLGSVPATPTCAIGTYSADRQACETPTTGPLCSTGAFYFPPTNQCVTFSVATCSTGNYNSASGQCQTPPTPTCSIGSYDATSMMCVIAPTPVCPTGFTLNTSRSPAVCQKPPGKH
jgi:hypothetical protein